MKKTLSIITGIFLICLLGGCWNELPEWNGNAGNVTFTIDGNTERTLRPAGINANAFERIELAISNDSGAVVSLVFDKGETSKTITLARGTWNVNAKGFLQIGDEVYEAAQGNSSVTVGASNTTAQIQLQTGIFYGAPGVFSYTVVFPADVNVVLELGPLNDLHGYDNPNVGKTLQLSATQTGSIEVSPGYYLLSITARAADKMGVWNELVHIYSGLETSMSHTFESGDLTGSVTLNGSLTVGELEGNRVQKALITAFSDINHVNRVTSVEVSGLAQNGAVYSGDWSMTVPASLDGKTLYMLIDETITGPGGTRTYTRSSVVPPGSTDINLLASYVWGHWVTPGGGITDESAMSCNVQPDGTIKVTTTQTVNSFEADNWRLGLSYNYPAEINTAYAYEFEAWTDSGELELEFVYFEYYQDFYTLIDWGERKLSRNVTITDEPTTFTVISTRRISADVEPMVKFHVGSPDFTGAFSITMKQIKPSNEYVPPVQGSGERFTATPVDGGIKLTVDLTGLPDNAEALAFSVHENGSMFQMDWRGLIYGWDDMPVEPRPDSYEMIFPYVDAGKSYTFELQWQGDPAFQMASIIHEPVTATSGRGELKFSNESELALLQEGNYLKWNKTPVVAPFTKTNITNERYAYSVASGYSWQDPLAQWRYGAEKTNAAQQIDLLDTNNLPDWYYPQNFSAVAGTTCFANGSYQFDYKNADIYAVGTDERLFGNFQTNAVSSTPFVYPNVVSGAFTAEPHAEGVMLRVDLTKIPKDSTTGLYFHIEDYSSMRLYVGAGEWQDPWGKFYGKNTVEIIYPFVYAGKPYTFVADYQSTGTVGQATVTPNAGLGEAGIANAGELGLLYSSSTQTMTLSGEPIVPVIGDHPQLTEKQWRWEFFRGYRWGMDDWAGDIWSEEPIMSVTFDDTFVSENMSWYIEEVSNTAVFIQYTYMIKYRGWDFATSVSTEPPAFIFPNFTLDPRTDVVIQTAFDTNRNLRLDYWDNIRQGDDLWVSIYDNNNYPHEQPSVFYMWFIDGEITSFNEQSGSLPTSELEPGMHYGLAVIAINDIPFGQEFAFRVTEN